MEDENAATRTSMFWGSSVRHVVYLEVLPLQNDRYDPATEPELNGATVKLELMKQTLNSGLKINWDKIDKTCSVAIQSGFLYTTLPNGEVKYVLYLEQSDPISYSLLWPCRCRGYSVIPNGPKFPYETDAQSICAVTESTIVRVLPVSIVRNQLSQYWKYQLTGEWPESPSLNTQDILQTQNPDTIVELTMRMKQLLSRRVTIGTTADAYNLQKFQKCRRKNIKTSLLNYFNNHNSKFNASGANVKKHALVSNDIMSLSSSLFEEGALLVHSPHNGAGKTSLVETIGRQCCDVVHIIRPDPLFSKYGIHVDAALETIVHEVILAAAINQQSICIILDHLDAILPPALTAATNTLGDAANPVLNACWAYLRGLTTQLQQRGKIPFPTKNPLYNIGGKEGCVLPVRLCFVAVITSPDDGFRSDILRIKSNSIGDNIVTAFDALVAGRYRLPNLTASTRLLAFQRAFRQEKIQLTPGLDKLLPFLAASAVWARGSAFSLVARQVRSQLTWSNFASVDDVTSVFSELGKLHASGSDVQFLASDEGRENELFDSVGGNNEAKSALDDGLGIHHNRRTLLLSLGLSPPTGILLYGPPGTGKTLLAKGVAQLLRSGSTAGSSVGGAFISLKSTDVARAEVGAGEKMLVTAFETARRNAPSVIFIDEFQSLFTERGNGGSGRLSTTLFQCMDNLKHWQDADIRTCSESKPESASKKILVLAATNTPWMVDKAFLRPGRFDRSIYVGLPDYEDRKAIFRLYIGKMKTRFGADASKLDIICEKLSVLTAGFSGADIAFLCHVAAMRCIIKNSAYVDDNHFFEAIAEGTGPSSDELLVDRIRRWRP